MQGCGSIRIFYFGLFFWERGLGAGCKLWEAQDDPCSTGALLFKIAMLTFCITKIFNNAIKAFFSDDRYT